jgi:hypothetical protein
MVLQYVKEGRTGGRRGSCHVMSLRIKCNLFFHACVLVLFVCFCVCVFVGMACLSLALPPPPPPPLLSVGAFPAHVECTIPVQLCGTLYYPVAHSSPSAI